MQTLAQIQISWFFSPTLMFRSEYTNSPAVYRKAEMSTCFFFFLVGGWGGSLGHLWLSSQCLPEPPEEPTLSLCLQTGSFNISAGLWGFHKFFFFSLVNHQTPSIISFNKPPFPLVEFNVNSDHKQDLLISAFHRNMMNLPLKASLKSGDFAAKLDVSGAHSEGVLSVHCSFASLCLKV